jgi:hypothetical protein
MRVGLELGDDSELLDLPVLIGSQEGVVVSERNAAVRVAIGAKHERVRQKSAPPIDAAIPDWIKPEGLHAVE